MVSFWLKARIVMLEWLILVAVVAFLGLLICAPVAVFCGCCGGSLDVDTPFLERSTQPTHTLADVGDEAHIHVYYARAIGALGAMVCHPWIAIKPRNGEWSSVQVIGWRLRSGMDS